MYGTVYKNMPPGARTNETTAPDPHVRKVACQNLRAQPSGSKACSGVANPCRITPYIRGARSATFDM